MRSVIYSAACSFDGYIAGPNEEIDWLHDSAEANAYLAEFGKSVDTIITGRKTYEFAQRFGGGAIPGIDETYVFSRTLDGVAKHATLIKDDAASFVRELKQRPGKDIWLWGGGDFARSMLDAGVLDIVSMNIHPVMLGSGVPLFAPGTKRAPLTLVENRTIEGGCILATYRVAR